MTRLYVPAVVATFPTDVVANAQSPNSISVVWNSLTLLDNDFILIYLVKFTPIETFSDTIGSHTIESIAPFVIRMRLQEYVNYSITVQARTNKGLWPLSVPVIEQTYATCK